jgi:hypothetical protein
LEEFINFDEKIIINTKKRKKQLHKIKNSLNLNNSYINNNKNKSSSRASGDLGKRANIIIKKKVLNVCTPTPLH